MVNDGSSDGSLSVLNEYKTALDSKKLALLKVFHTENLGAASARNLGILESHGDLSAFVDADDVWFTNKLSRQVAEIELRGVDYVCGMGLYLKDSESMELTPLIELDKLKEVFVSNFGINPILPSGLIIKKSAMARTGIFDTALKGPCEDYDLTRRITRELHGAVLADPLLYYRIHSSNVSRRKVGKIKKDYRLALAKQCADNETSVSRRTYFRSQLEFRLMKRAIKSRIHEF